MVFYHKLALVALLSGSATAWAQPQRPPVSADEDVDDDENGPRSNDGMPPPDPRAYQQGQPPQEYEAAAQQYGYMGPHPVPYEVRSEEHTSELQSQSNLVCRLLLEKKQQALRQR